MRTWRVERKLLGTSRGALEVRPKMGVEAKIASRRERKEPTPTAYLIDPPRGRLAAIRGWMAIFAADSHFSAGPLAAAAALRSPGKGGG